MGLALYPSSLNAQINETIEALTSDNNNLLAVIDNISDFVNDESLTGTAWQSMKAHLDNHMTIIQGIICANDQVVSDHHTLQASIGREKLIEDELQEKIDALKRINTSMESNINAIRSLEQSSETLLGNPSYYTYSIQCYQSVISHNQVQIRELEGKIDKLYEIENNTSNLFSSAGALYDAVAEGITSLRQSWNGEGQLDLSNLDTRWKGIINQTWTKKSSDIYRRYRTEVSIAEVKDILDMINAWGEIPEKILNNFQNLELLFNGVHFTLNKRGSKYYLHIADDFVDSLIPNKWNNFADFLTKNFKEYDWEKSDMKALLESRKGWRTDSDFLKNIHYKNMTEYLMIIKKAEENGASIWRTTFNKRFTEEINILDNFNVSKYTDDAADILGNTGRALGALGTIVTVGSNFYDNIYADGQWNFTPDSVQDFLTDSAVDIGWEATSAAAGAAIGSFFAPPVGTAVGAIAGIAIGAAGEIGITDVDGDGEKDSLVDMAKIGLDTAFDYIGSLF